MSTKTKFLLFCCCLSFTLTSALWSQERKPESRRKSPAEARLWKSKSDSLMQALQDDLFKTYMRVAVSLAGKNASAEQIKTPLTKAIKLNPHRKSVVTIAPPEVEQLFQEMRKEIVGCVYIVSEPPGARVEGDSIAFGKLTPTSLCDTEPKKYDIVLNKRSYEKQNATIELTPGQWDTLFIALNPISFSPPTAVAEAPPDEEAPTEVSMEPQNSEQKKSGSWMKWFWGGIAGVGVAAVLSTTVLSNKGGGNVIEQLDDLPEPPDRP